MLRLSRLAAFHQKKWLFVSYIRSAAVVVLTGGCILHTVCCCGSAQWSVPNLAATGYAWCLPVYTDSGAEFQGVLRKGQEIEIRPGIVTKDAEGRAACIPIYSRIITLLAEQNDLQYAVPGGLIGVGTTVSITDLAVIHFCPVADVTPKLNCHTL